MAACFVLNGSFTQTFPLKNRSECSCRERLPVGRAGPKAAPRFRGRESCPPLSPSIPPQSPPLQETPAENIHDHTHTLKLECTHSHMYLLRCTQTYTQIPTHTHMHTHHTHTDMHTHAHVSTYTCTHIPMDRNVHTHSHIPAACCVQAITQNSRACPGGGGQ